MICCSMPGNYPAARPESRVDVLLGVVETRQIVGLRKFTLQSDSAVSN
jgi:hypothetical protein